MRGIDGEIEAFGKEGSDQNRLQRDLCIILHFKS